MVGCNENHKIIVGQNNVICDYKNMKKKIASKFEDRLCTGNRKNMKFQSILELIHLSLILKLIIDRRKDTCPDLVETHSSLFLAEFMIFRL